MIQTTKRFSVCVQRHYSQHIESDRIKVNPFNFYYIYNIRVARRYSDFDTVRQRIVENWPGCFVPMLPQKKIIGNGQKEFVFQRMEGLTKWTQSISHRKHLWYGKQFQILIRGHQDVSKEFKIKNHQNAAQIIGKYRQTLTYVKDKLVNADILNNICQFQNYLKKTMPLISSLKEVTKQYSSCNIANNQQYTILLACIFPEYQKSLLFQDNLQTGYLLNQNQVFINILSQIRSLLQSNKIQSLVQVLSNEHQQLQVFQQLFKRRIEFQTFLNQAQLKGKDLQIVRTKLDAGKQGTFNTFIKKNIQQDKQANHQAIKVNQDKIDNLIKLVHYINVIMDIEIKWFKMDKFKTYDESIKQVIQFQIRFCKIKERLCQSLLQSKQLKGCQLEQIE